MYTEEKKIDSPAGEEGKSTSSRYHIENLLKLNQKCVQYDVMLNCSHKQYKG